MATKKEEKGQKKADSKSSSKSIKESKSASKDKSKKESIPAQKADLNESKDDLKTTSSDDSPEEIIEEINQNKIQYPEGVPYEPEPMLDPKPRLHPKVTFGGILLGLILAAAIIYGVFWLVEYDKAEIVPPEPVIEEIINKTPVPVQYSLSSYITNSDYYNGLTISTIGFLKHDLRPIGKTAFMNDYYIVDDYGNNLTLSFTKIKDPNYFEPLFVRENTTETLFNVTGVFTKEGEYVTKLYVTKIYPARREYVLK